MKNTSKRMGYSDVAGILRDEIHKNVFPELDRLPPERMMVERFGVARGTIREALNMLAKEGLIITKRGSGTYIASKQIEPSEANHIIQSATPLELMDARFALEPHICRLAVLNARPEHLKKGQDLIKQMDESLHDSQAFSSIDSAFHLLLAESTGNQPIIWIMKQIDAIRHQEAWNKMRRLTLNKKSILLYNKKSMFLYNKEHKELLNTIKMRMPEQAATIMKTHLKSTWLALTDRDLG